MERSWAPLSFFLLGCGKVIVLFCLCLLDVIVELRAMDEKMFNEFIIG